MKLRNVSPMGDLFVPAIGRTWPAGAVFEVPDDLGENLRHQVNNFQPVDPAVPRENVPDSIERGSWPTPAWWHEAEGWNLLVLRCLDCHHIACRFIVPALDPVGRGIAGGRWLSASDARDPRNRVATACGCRWEAWPTPDEPRMNRALRLALAGPRPDESRNATTLPPQTWGRATRGEVRPTVLNEHPGAARQ